MILDFRFQPHEAPLLDFQFLVFNFQLLVFIGRFVYGSKAADKHCPKDSKDFRLYEPYGLLTHPQYL